MYGVRVSARAERDLDQLPAKVAHACVAFVFGPLAENPQRLGGELRGRLAGLRSARRGSYRIVYRIDEERRLVEIVHIDHRGSVYRPS